MNGRMTRRGFVRAGVAAGVVAGAGRWAGAETLNVPLGLQLYSVREMLPKDPQEVLDKIGALGYKQVEAAGFFGYDAQQVKGAMAKAGLDCVSAHYPYAKLAPAVDEIIAFHKVLGAPNIVCASPGRKPGSPTEGAPTMADWKWNAEQFNVIGKKIKDAGMQFAYHNHFWEFQKIDGQVPYEALLQGTDPAVVNFELDCGWVVIGGGDPMAVLRAQKNRIHMLHLKDFAKSDQPFSETHRPEPVVLGKGFVPLKAIVETAAQIGTIQHVFIEQEAFPGPPYEVLKEDAEYLKSIGG